MMVSKIVEYIKHPSKIFIFLQNRCNFKVLPDKQYLRICYKLTFGKKLDFDNPQTFNEKLQWLKLYDRNPKYTTMVDKYDAKKYISNLIGEGYVIPTLGVWDNFDEINFDLLPDQFVLKCTHDSGGLIICRDKSKLNKASAKKKICRSIKRNYYWSSREGPYKNVKPRIIAEPYMEEHNCMYPNHVDANILTDYKFFCFNGIPKVMYIAKDIGIGPESDYFDMDFVHLPIIMDGDSFAPVPPVKPKHFEKMKEIAAVLSRNIPHIRVDFYCVDDKLYVGELTFFHSSGTCPIRPAQWDYRLGEWIQLPRHDS